MSELTAALAGCQQDDDVNVSAAATNFAGDQSVLIELASGPLNNPALPYVGNSYKAVIRADDVVLSIHIGPFESGGITRERAQTILDLAIHRAED
jgi:hypothetical protein